MIYLLQQHQPHVSSTTWRNIAAYSDVNEAARDLTFYPADQARVVKVEARGNLLALLRKDIDVNVA